MRIARHVTGVVQPVSYENSSCVSLSVIQNKRHPHCYRHDVKVARTRCSSRLFLLKGVIIDPVDVTAERDAQMASEMGLKVTLLVNTHVHADHITGTGKLKKMISGSRSVLSEVSGGQADVKINEGDKIHFGSRCDPHETNTNLDDFGVNLILAPIVHVHVGIPS